MYWKDVEDVYFAVENVLDPCSKCTGGMFKMYERDVQNVQEGCSKCTGGMLMMCFLVFRMYLTHVQNVLNGR